VEEDHQSRQLGDRLPEPGSFVGNQDDSFPDRGGSRTSDRNGNWYGWLQACSCLLRSRNDRRGRGPGGRLNGLQAAASARVVCQRGECVAYDPKLRPSLRD
jgi:hypothetical protein